jgi:dCTP deaminase
VILTDREIKIALGRKLIGIDPAPPDDSYSSTSIDLMLGANISVFKKQTSGLDQVIDFANIENYDAVLSKMVEQIILPDDGFLLQPQAFILAWTLETIDLKIESRIAARVEGKSSLARFGLGVHVTAPTIHSGFRGHIRLEIANHGPIPVKLRSGMKVCQLIFEQTLGTPEKGYSGQFQNQISR